jgi:hypothetical protein
MKREPTLRELFNLTDEQWGSGADGVYLDTSGWYVRKDGHESGPWGQREFAEKAAPEFFEGVRP